MKQINKLSKKLPKLNSLKNLKKRKLQRGGFAMEAIGGLSLLALLIGYSMHNLSSDNDKRMAEIAASHHKTVSDSAAAYVKDYYAELLDLIPDEGDVTTVSFATLQNEGYVSSSLSATNIWGQKLNVRLRRGKDSNPIEALVIAEGGRQVEHELAREVSQFIGAEGGYTVSAGDFCGTKAVSTNMLCGTRGVWERPVADFNAPVAPGRIASALFFKDGMLVNDYLYRKRIPGKPELNTMETYLQMGTGASATEGQPCYSVKGDSNSPLLENGAIATTTEGLILSCQSGRWLSQSASYSGDLFSVSRSGVNTYGRPLLLTVRAGLTRRQNYVTRVYVGGLLVASAYDSDVNNSNLEMTLTVFVPINQSWSVTGTYYSIYGALL